MSALTADVQIYNYNYLINISSAVAASYAPVQNVFRYQSAHVPQNFSLFIADRWIGSSYNGPHEGRDHMASMFEIVAAPARPQPNKIRRFSYSARRCF
jgi:hypothetical protein